MTVPIGLVIGGAEGVDAEYDRAASICEHRGISWMAFVVNDQIPVFVPACHVVTLHFDKLPAWLSERKANGLAPPIDVWSQRSNATKPFITRVVDQCEGSSAMVAVHAALKYGCERVMLCGVPMIAAARHFKTGKRWDDCYRYEGEWRTQAPALRSRVRSFSGLTAALLGEPSDDFIAGAKATA